MKTEFKKGKKININQQILYINRVTIQKLNALRESNKCRYALREPIYRNCNTQKCEGNTDLYRSI